MDSYCVADFLSLILLIENVFREVFNFLTVRFVAINIERKLQSKIQKSFSRRNYLLLPDNN